MKSRSSNKKKKVDFIQQKSGEQTATPRMKKSYSVTKTNYLQLQLDTSGKKRQCLERKIAGKDKRIVELQEQIKEYQDNIIHLSSKCKDYKEKYNHERAKNQRMQLQLREAVMLCKNMNEKCQEVFSKKEELQISQKQWKKKAEEEEHKLKQLKLLRKRQKKQIRELIMYMLPLIQSNQSNIGSQQLKKLSKMI